MISTRIILEPQTQIVTELRLHSPHAARVPGSLLGALRVRRGSTNYRNVMGICVYIYYTILYYTILYYIILYYIVLYYIILYYIILYYIIYVIILYYIILYYIILYYIILYYNVYIDIYIRYYIYNIYT